VQFIFIVHEDELEYATICSLVCMREYEDVRMCVRAQRACAYGMCLSVLKMSAEIHTNHSDAVAL